MDNYSPTHLDYLNLSALSPEHGKKIVDAYLQRRETLTKITALIERIEAERPNDRRDDDRRYAVIITDLEKIAAYYAQWLV